MVKNLSKVIGIFIVLSLILGSFAPAFAVQDTAPQALLYGKYAIGDEVIELRTENSKTRWLGGNKYSAEISIGAIHYKDNYSNLNETWKDIDLTFVNNQITKAPYILTVSPDNYSLTMFDKRTGSTASLALSTIGNKSCSKITPTISKGKVTFKNVATDLDIEIVADNARVRFKRILKSDKAPAEAVFGLSQSGTGIAVTSEARYVDDGKAIPVIASKSGGLLIETIDKTKITKYPVEIDPTLTIQPSSKDNYIEDGAPTVNFGTDTLIYLGRHKIIGVTIWRSLVEFAITWGTDIPAGATLNSATLSLYMDSVSGTGKTYYAQRLLRLDWHETQSTWTIYKTGSNWSTAGAANDGADYTSTDQASANNPAADNWMDWNVLNQVKTAQTGSLQIAFRVVHSTEATDNEYLYARSKEHATTATRPKLVIDYTAVTSPTVTISAASLIEATTARLNGNVTATGGENPTVTVYWGTSDGGQVPANWANNSAPTSPGQPQGVAAFYKDATGLPTGTTVYFSAKATNSGGTGWPAASLSFLTKPAAPTAVAATDGTDTSKVVITWTKSTGATGYRVYEGVNNIGGLLGDVATYDDTAAPAPTITAGTASASDNTSSSVVTLSIAGESANVGASRTYKVVAVNATGNSADSATDTGYRGVGALTYQWQRSAADSDATYSNISGGTTDPYNDTGGVYTPDGRYYKCVLDATGAAQQITNADRGYMAIGPPTVTISAASLVEATTARLNGNVTATGGENPSVTVYWGTSDGLQVPANWANNSAPTSPGQPQGVAAFYKDVTGLPTGTTVYFSAKATSSGGTGWPAASLSFLTKPAAPTNVAATDGTDTTKVVVTWTKSTGATGYKIYEGVNLLGTVGDVATYDDTTAPAPTITPGTADATDGASSTIVTLTLSGHSASNGSSRTYKVKATNATGDSVDSNTDTGYRGTTTLTYQWQRSAADSDAGYGDIGGGTTNPYNDTGGVAYPSGRYYKCVVSMTGATPQGSAVNRGWLLTTPTVTTSAATSVEETSATFNGNITSTGGENCTRGFEWDINSGVPYASSWTDAGTHAAGAYTCSGAPLSQGTLYYYRSKATNSVGTSYGSEVTFLTKPDPPTGLVVTTTSSTQLTLAWVKGAGADRSMVRYNVGVVAPTSITDGTQIYLGTGSGYGHTQLDIGTQYSYSVWSEITSGGWTKYSDTYVSASGTTSGTATYLTNFKYYIPITVTSSCATAQELRIPFIINSAGLSSGGYVQADFDDVVLARVDTLMPLTVTDIAASTLRKSSEATSNGSTISLIDNTLTQVDDYWNGCTLKITQTTDGLAPQGESKTVSDYTNATDNLTFAALTAATHTGDLYTVGNYRSKYFTNLELAPYQQVVLRLYLGYAAAGAADREFCTKEADTVSVDHHADFNITDNVTVTATVKIFDLPGAVKTLVSKSGAYELGLDASNKPYFKIWHGAATDNATGSAALVKDTEYILKGTYNDASDNITVYVDGAVAGSKADATGAITATDNATVLMDLDNCEVDDIKIGKTSLAAPTYVLNLVMEASGAGAIGEVSILDQYGHNAAITWDISLPSCITVEVGAVTEVATWGAPGSAEEGEIGVFELPTEPTNWMPTKTDFTAMPAYPLVHAAGLQLGWTDATMYRIMVMFTAIGVGAAIGIATASALLTGIATGTVLAAGAGAGIIGFWVVLLYGIFAMGYIVASRSM